MGNRRIRRGNREMGVPKDVTVPDGCVGADTLIRFIWDRLETANVYVAYSKAGRDIILNTAEILNDNDMFISPDPAQRQWTQDSVDNFYWTYVGADAFDDRRKAWPGWQIWDRRRLIDYVDALKEAGYKDEFVADWLNRERITHHRRIVSKSPEWSADQITALMTTGHNNGGLKSENPIKSWEPTADAVKIAEQTDYRVLTSDEVIVEVYGRRRAGSFWTRNDFVDYFNTRDFVRGDVRGSDASFTIKRIDAMFARRDLTFNDPTPDWVNRVLVEEHDEVNQRYRKNPGRLRAPRTTAPKKSAPVELPTKDLSQEAQGFLDPKPHKKDFKSVADGTVVLGNDLEVLSTDIIADTTTYKVTEWTAKQVVRAVKIGSKEYEALRVLLKRQEARKQRQSKKAPVGAADTPWTDEDNLLDDYKL